MEHDTDMFWFCLFAATVCLCPCSAAFIEASQSLPAPARAATGINMLEDPTDIYELANAQLFADQVPTGKISFKPHDLEDINLRPVYDPGDELLRALNADIAANGRGLGTLPMEPDYADTVYNEMELVSKYDILHKLKKDLQEEEDVINKSAVLMKMLEDPSIETLPVIYVEEAMTPDDTNNNSPDFIENTNGLAKRTSNYRRYPYKRHSKNRSYHYTSSTYVPELRYACIPTKEDVFKLLVNLHENRNGKNGKTVNFCNRKRPAKSVFTNMRFLG